MIKVLWFSLCPPYREVKHAGGQALYKHVISFLQHKEIEIKMVSLYKKEEYKYVQILAENYSIELIPDEAGSLFLLDYESRWNPWNRFGGYLSNSRFYKLRKCINKLSKQGYKPDLIILNWTELLALCPSLKQIYPKTKFIAIEEDVSFVKRRRRIENSSNKIAKLFHYLRYIHCVNKECNWLQQVNIIAVYSDKDKNRLEDMGLVDKKIFAFSPVFSDKTHLKWNRKNNDIIFWGAMSRRENSDSAIWFIENVMPLLETEDCRFVVVGANPPKELMIRESERIKVTGFVENPNKYFEDSMCMVVPLQIGAGIKIKVLEGLSSGIPVISNEIGIEGINVRDRIHYLHAETATEFADAIKKIKCDTKLAQKLSSNAKMMIFNNYNETQSTEQFIMDCKELIK